MEDARVFRTWAKKAEPRPLASVQGTALASLTRTLVLIVNRLESSGSRRGASRYHGSQSSPYDPEALGLLGRQNSRGISLHRLEGELLVVQSHALFGGMGRLLVSLALVGGRLVVVWPTGGGIWQHL